MKLSIIALTYNNLEYTKKFVESVFKYTKDFELIIVDNGSTDGTREYLKSRSDIKVILNDENLGFSKGNNQGIELAQGEYIGFLNNDILLYPQWFEEVEKVFEAENAAFVSPRHVNPHYDNTNERAYIKYFQKQIYLQPYEKTFDECVFSCVITKRSVLDKIGVFDEKYTPAFFEDNDFKFRAIDAGYHIFVSNRVCFFHFGSVTSKNFSKGFEVNRKYYYSKFPAAEYLEITGHEKYALQRQVKLYNIFPLNVLYSIIVFFIKGKNRLRKMLRTKA